MPIKMIRNSTDADLQLWDGRVLLTTVPAAGSVQQVSVVITQVIDGAVTYANRQGAFVDGDSYDVTLTAAGTLLFSGNQSQVSFTP